MLTNTASTRTSKDHANFTDSRHHGRIALLSAQVAVRWHSRENQRDHFGISEGVSSGVTVSHPSSSGVTMVRWLNLFGLSAHQTIGYLEAIMGALLMFIHLGGAKGKVNHRIVINRGSTPSVCADGCIKRRFSPDLKRFRENILILQHSPDLDILIQIFSASLIFVARDEHSLCFLPCALSVIDILSSLICQSSPPG